MGGKLKWTLLWCYTTLPSYNFIEWMISKIAAAAVCEKARAKKTVKCIQGVITKTFLIKSQLLYGFASNGWWCYTTWPSYKFIEWMISKIAALAVCQKAGAKKTVKCIQGVINTTFLIKSQLIYCWAVVEIKLSFYVKCTTLPYYSFIEWMISKRVTVRLWRVSIKDVHSCFKSMVL